MGRRLKNFEARLDAGVKDGSLTRAEAGRIRQEIDRLRAEHPEGLTAKDLNTLNRRIFSERHDVDTNLGRRFDSALSDIDRALRRGSISEAQARILAGEILDALSRFGGGGDTKALGGELNTILERLRLAQSYNENHAQLESRRHGAVRV